MPRRALFAWELGGGYGHLRQLLPIVDGIAGRGHRVTLALREPATAQRELAAIDHTSIEAPAFIEAPVWRGPVPADLVAASYAELLLLNGFATAEVVRGLIVGWLEVFANTRPDLVVAEAAPAAMLAARVAGVPVASIGTGWSLPPRTTPLPPLRPWDDVSAQRIVAAEDRILGTINAALVAFAVRPLERLAAVFDASAEFLCTFAELDHYEGRGEADYYGSIYGDDRGIAPEWPDGRGPRVFAYVNARHAPFDPLIEALGMLELPTVLHARNLDRTPSCPPNVWLAAEPVQVGAALRTSRVVICQGHGTLSAALVAGRPVLLLPEHPEQMMLLARTMRQGFGLGVAEEADAGQLASTLRRLLEVPGYTERAQLFAARYHGYDPSLATAAIVADCCELMT